MRSRKPRPAPHSNRMPRRAGTKRAMEPLMLFVLVLLLLVLGLPIAVALGLSSVLFLLLFSTDSLASIALKLFQAQQHYTLLAIPYFILRSEEHTSELQSLMCLPYAVFCLKKTNHIL